MLPLQFFGQNVHFALSLFAALVFFAVFWLYFDAWASETHKKNTDILKWSGFLAVSLGFLVGATVVDQSLLDKSILGNDSQTVATILRLLGYIFIIAGEIMDPVQKKPQTKSLDAEFLDEPVASRTPALAASTSSFGLGYGLPLGALTIAVLYWRRSTKGLENHLKPVAIAFLLLFGFELFSLASLWQNTTNPTLFNLVKSFGPLWIAGQVFLLAGVLTLGRWVWRYLTERFLSQMFMILTSAVLVIFLLTTVSFTFLLLRSVQNDRLDNLQTAANVLNYALDSKQAETMANAEIIAQNTQVAQAVATKDHKALVALTGNFLGLKKQSTLDITGSSGQVLLRAEDPNRWDDSVSSDSLVRRALAGDSFSSVTTQSGVLAPVVYVKSTVPIRDSTNKIVGTSSVSLAIDNALVDGIKASTGLDSAVYSGNELSATTLTGPDGKSRLIGLKEANTSVTNTVLDKGQSFKGQLNILNQPYSAVFAPLKSADSTVVGMLFIGQPQASILKTAGHSIELTFAIAVLLIVLSIIPAYMVARHIARQLE